MTIKKLLLQGAMRLKEKNIENPRLEAEILLAHILQIKKTELILRDNDEVEEEGYNAFQKVLAKRENREPIAYITGHKEFYGNNFIVTKDVLIPRPDTEILVDAVIEKCKCNKFHCNIKEWAQNIIKGGNAGSELKEMAEVLGDAEGKYDLFIDCPSILDLCAGSGCIGISIARNMNAKILLADISEKALAVAKKNAEAYDLQYFAFPFQSNLFQNIPNSVKFNIIVSNPPYIPTAEIDKLAKDVSYEPKIALDGGVDGLDYYRKIIVRAKKYLMENGLLFLEIGIGQSKAVVNLMTKNNYRNIEVKKDLAGIERVVIGEVCT